VGLSDAVFSLPTFQTSLHIPEAMLRGPSEPEMMTMPPARYPADLQTLAEAAKKPSANPK
jgi:hypothetical protein